MDTPLRPPRLRTGTRSQEPDDAALRAAARAALRAKSRRATLQPRSRRPTKHAFGSSLPPSTDGVRRPQFEPRRHSYVDYLRNGTPEKRLRHSTPEKRSRVEPIAYEEEDEREPLYFGCRVDVFDRKGRPRRLDCGGLRFLGPTEFSSGRQVWCGIELDLPYGTHDGEVEGRRYFGPVGARCGLLVTAELCRRVPGQPSALRARRDDSSTDSAPSRTRSLVDVRAADATPPPPVVVVPPPPPPTTKPVPAACRTDPALTALFADASLARYFKMLSVGVPRTAVAQKMRDDGIGAEKCAIMAGQPATLTPKKVAAATQKSPSKEKARTAPSARNGFRRLHWNSLDHSSAEKSLYAADQLASPFDTSSRDFARLRSAFGARAPPVERRRSITTEKRPAPKAPASALDARRAMNVGIMLGKLVGSGAGRFESPRACCAALMGSSGTLSVDQLELLIAIAPSDVEREKLVFSSDGVYATTPAEAALAELGAVPLCRPRADALLLTKTALPRLAVVLVDAALRCKACRYVRRSTGLARFLATMLGAANATRLAEASGIELGSLLALARTRADDDERRRKTLLDFVVDVLSRRGERRTALGFAGPFSKGDVVVAARSRRRRRAEAAKKATLSDDDASGSESSMSESSDESDDDVASSPSQRRRHRKQRRDLVQAAKWLPAPFVQDMACAETVVSRRIVHGGLARCAHRGAPNELAAVVSTLRRRVAAARAVAKADRACEFDGERDDAMRAIAAARAAETRRREEDRDRAMQAAENARRALDAAGMKEREAMGREDAAAQASRTAARRARAEKAALVALSVLCAAARDADAYCERVRTQSPVPKETPQDWAAKRRERIERARKIRADRLDFAPPPPPQPKLSPKTRRAPGSWRPPSRIAAAILHSPEGAAPMGVLRAAHQWAAHALVERDRRAPPSKGSCYALLTEEDPRLMDPGDSRNPFFGLVARVLALAKLAVAVPAARPAYLEAMVKKPAPPPVERRLFKPPPRASLLAALNGKPVDRGGLLAAIKGGQPVPTTKKAVSGPRPPHLMSSQRRQAGEALDAHLDGLEGALDAADAAIACARAHGAMLRIHMGCAAHEDAAEALEVVGQLARLVDASLARAPLDVETSDEEDATRLRVGAVVSTKWGPAVVEARRPAADAAQPRRVACRTFWRARVICEKADVLSAPCAVKSPFGVVDLQDRVVKRADGTLLCSIKLPDARGEMLLPPCSINYVPPVTTRVWRRRRPAASPRSGPATPQSRVASSDDDASSAASESSDLSDVGALGSFLEI